MMHLIDFGHEFAAELQAVAKRVRAAPPRTVPASPATHARCCQDPTTIVRCLRVSCAGYS